MSRKVDIEIEASRLVDLQNRIESLEKKEEKVDNVIGEYFLEWHNWGAGGWTKFSQKDLEDKVDGHIKIEGIWFKKENVFFYDDIYKSIREKIEKANEKKEKKK